MFKFQSKTFMELVLENEDKEFQEFYHPSKFSESKTITSGDNLDQFDSGNIIIEADSASASFNNLITRSKIVTNRDKLRNNKSPHFYEYNALMNNVYSEISIVKNMGTFRECINIIDELKNALGSNFFGVLLVDKRPREPVIINPLHPLVALTIVDDKNFLDSSYIYEAVVFSYKDRKEMDSYYRTSDADKKIIDENINNLITCHAEKKEEVVESVVFDEKIDQGSIEFKYKFRDIGQDRNKNVNYLLIPHQILTNGTYIPWYGTSVIKKYKNGEESTGMSVSPFFSCNINFDSSMGTQFDSKYATEENQAITPLYGSVCTGSSYSNTTFSGLKTLTHSNASSPYSTYVVTQGSLAYADRCIERSLEMYKIVEIIKKLSPEEIDENLKNRPGSYLGVNVSDKSKESPYASDFRFDQYSSMNSLQFKRHMNLARQQSEKSITESELTKEFKDVLLKRSLRLSNPGIYNAIMNRFYWDLNLPYSGRRTESYFINTLKGKNQNYLYLNYGKTSSGSAKRLHLLEEPLNESIEIGEFLQIAITQAVDKKTKEEQSENQALNF